MADSKKEADKKSNGLLNELDSKLDDLFALNGKVTKGAEKRQPIKSPLDDVKDTPNAQETVDTHKDKGAKIKTEAPATPAAAKTPTLPKAGAYCPDTDILRVVAEELSASLDLAMRSKAAMLAKDQVTAISELTSTGTTLRLAASRGAAARSILLIDAIIQARSGEDYAQMLTWFPLLQTSLLTLPDDETVSSAADLIGRAEDIMQGAKEGEPLKVLGEARHMLACDDLDIPLQRAKQVQLALMKQLGSGNPVKSSAYDALLDSLRSALTYTLKSDEN